MLAQIQMAIQRIVSTIPEDSDLYGIGSFFDASSSTFSDVDLVLVINDGTDRPAQRARLFREEARRLGELVGIVFDLTVLTQTEFAEKPLREMGKLVLLAHS